MKNKLSKQDIESIIHECATAIMQVARIHNTNHSHKAIMLVILGLKTRAEKKICGLTKPGYSFKITMIEFESLLFVRNDLGLNMLHAPSVTRLLELNK